MFNERNAGSFLRWTLLAVFLVLSMAAAPAADASETGVCVQAFIQESIVLPDGSLHAPGTIRICLEREFSPVAGLHETSIDGRTIGLFQSRFVLSEGLAEDRRARLVFQRIAEDRLALLGYAVPGRERTAVYWMKETRRARRGEPRPPSSLDLAGRVGGETGDIHLVLAALR